VNIAIIPARGGSRRIPGKNIKTFHGKPMLARTIETARIAGCFDRLIVSTDDDRIARITRDAGAEVPFRRPAELSDDHTGTTLVIAHALEWCLREGMDVSLACCLYATAPFLEPDDILKGLACMADPAIDYAFAVARFNAPIQRALRISASGSLTMFDPSQFHRRSQDLEAAWHDAAQFYWGRAQAWIEGRVIFSARSAPVILPSFRVQDIDSPEDWQRAEVLYRVLKETAAQASGGASTPAQPA